MWQRIQTIFLGVVFLCCAVSVFMPIWVLKTATEKHELYALHYSITQNPDTAEVIKKTTYFPYMFVGVLLAAAATLSVMEIRRFDNRMTQMKLGALNSLFLALGLGGAVYFANTLLTQFKGGVYGFGLWLPAAAAIFNWLAMRFIRRDERIVRDSQRLR